MSYITSKGIESKLALAAPKAKVALLSRKTTIDEQAVAEDERGLAGGEPNHCVGDFLRGSDSADRMPVRHRRARFGLLPEKAARHVGLDHGGQHRIDADALLAE